MLGERAGSARLVGAPGCPANAEPGVADPKRGAYPLTGHPPRRTALPHRSPQNEDVITASWVTLRLRQSQSQSGRNPHQARARALPSPPLPPPGLYSAAVTLLVDDMTASIPRAGTHTRHSVVAGLLLLLGYRLQLAASQQQTY